MKKQRNRKKKKNKFNANKTLDRLKDAEVVLNMMINVFREDGGQDFDVAVTCDELLKYYFEVHKNFVEPVDLFEKRNIHMMGMIAADVNDRIEEEGKRIMVEQSEKEVHPETPGQVIEEKDPKQIAIKEPIEIQVEPIKEG